MLPVLSQAQSYAPSCTWPAHFRPAVYLNIGSFTAQGHDATEVKHSLVRAIDSWNVMGGAGTQLAYSGHTTQDRIDSAIVVHMGPQPRGRGADHARTDPNHDCDSDGFFNARDICKTPTCAGGAKLSLYYASDWEFVADWIPPPTGLTAETRIDFWSIFQHELGHGLGLGHPACPGGANVNSVMCLLPPGYVTLGSQKRRYPTTRDADALRGGSGIYDRPGLCLATSQTARTGWTTQHLAVGTINKPAITFGYHQSTTTPVVCVAFIDTSTGANPTVTTIRSTGGSFGDAADTDFHTSAGLALAYSLTAEPGRRRFVMAYTEADTRHVKFTWSRNCQEWNPMSVTTTLTSHVAPEVF